MTEALNVGDYAMFGDREVKIIGHRTGLRSGVDIYHIEWWDRWDGRKTEHVFAKDLLPAPDVSPSGIRIKMLQAENSRLTERVADLEAQIAALKAGEA